MNDLWTRQPSSPREDASSRGEEVPCPGPIAVIGAACRLPPDLTSAEALMAFLLEGRVAAGPAPSWRWSQWSTARAGNGGEVPEDVPLQGSYLSGAERFDAAFFGMSPREARCLDPQQRIVLEVAWEALEHAGVVPDRLRGSRTGVFIGVGSDDYGRMLQDDLSRIEAWSGVGGALCGTANRISYHLDLKGPSIAVDTACSSSLTALHMACQSLQTGECDLAVVGGVQVVAAPMASTALHRAGALATDGRCKSFSTAADGYGRGEGAGVVVLRPARTSLAQGDRVLAVIRGSAVGQDGDTGGIMAPSGRAQAEFLWGAYRRAGVDPRTVSYVEAHGTGTQAGDAAEVDALREVFGAGREDAEPCLVGTLKPNIGHLEAAAGIAGVIKSVAALRDRMLPPTVLHGPPTPAVNGDGLRLVDEPTPWPASSGPLRCGVSSFGYGGSLAHAVLEEAPAVSSNGSVLEDSGPVLLPLSGSSAASLARTAAAVADWTAGHPHVPLRSVAHTLALRRAHLEQRAVVVADGHQQAVDRLRSVAQGSPASGTALGPADGSEPTAPVLVFSGHGSQWRGMGRELLDQDPEFRGVIESLEEVFRREADFDLAEELRDGKCDDVGRVQPVIFALQLGLAESLRAHGVRPAAVLGHSVGEIAAAVVAGVLTPQDGARLVCRRSRLLRACAGDGAMVLVDLPFEETVSRLDGREDLVAAVHASPDTTVVSGRHDSVRDWSGVLTAEGRTVREVDSGSVAFHSPAMNRITSRLATAARDLRPREPDVQVYSTAAEDPRSGVPRDAGYWVSNLRDPVRLTEAVEAAVQDGHRCFLEVSSHPVVTHSILQTLEQSGASAPSAVALPTLRRGRPLREELLACLGALHCQGVPVAWPRLAPPGDLVDLPRRSWDHQAYWTHESAAATRPDDSVQTHRASARALVHRTDWEPYRQVPGAAPGTATVVGEGPLAHAVSARWPELDVPTRLFTSPSELSRAAAPRARDGGPLLFVPSQEAGAPTPAEAAERCAEQALQLVQWALNSGVTGKGDKVWFVTQGVRDASDESALAHAALWGMGRAIAAEHPHLWGGLVDLAPADLRDLPSRLLTLVSTPSEEDVISTDGQGTWVPRLVPADSEPADGSPQCSPDGSYLITGGFGALGTRVARRLADRGARHLTLVGRRAQPSKVHQELEKRGVAIRALALDITDREAVRRALTASGPDTPPVRGVVHAAGVLNGRLLDGLSPTDLTTEMRAKAQGAWWLHELYPPGSLDFFTLFSSAGPYVKAAGQAGYAAANAFLETLATHRRSAGDRGTQALAWSAWRGGLGLAASAAPEFEAQGVGDIDPEEALEAWDHAAALGGDRAAVLHPLPPSEGSVRLPLLRRLGTPGADPDAAPRPWQHLTGDDLRAHLLEYITGQIAAETGAAPEGVTPDSPLTSLGLDSVMAAAVRTRLQARLGAGLPAGLLHQQPTVNAVTDYVLGLVTDSGQKEPAS